MAYTLSELADDIRSVLTKASAADSSQELCNLVRKALVDDGFINQHLTEREEGQNPREVLYEDEELGFCICAHVYGGEAIGGPHDHGPSWAIYGQAVGETEMIDWRIVDEGSDVNPKLVEFDKSYTMKPGDAHFYDIGFVHSPKRTAPVRLIRIEGQNLDNATRSNIIEAPG